MATDLAHQTQSTSLPITALTPALLEELYLALSTIRFGTIELVIHDGRVVQLEKREKVRFQTEVTHARR
jgi:hypothetical protein